MSCTLDSYWSNFGQKEEKIKSMQMHGHFKTETNNTSCKGNTALWQLPTRKIRKFIKSKFKILTCVVLLGRLNTMRGISAGKYDKGNKSIMMRGIWVGEIYIAINYISIVSASYYPVTVKTTTNFSNICYLLLKSFLIRFLYIFVLWEVSTGDAVMTRLFCQSLCYALSYVAMP